MIKIDGNSLTIETYNQIVFEYHKVTLSEEGRVAVKKAREMVESFDKGEDPIYGINTGFGFLSNKKIDKDQIEQLQVNLIRSHCTAVGEPYNNFVVRGMMLLRANVMSKGISGIRDCVIDLLLNMLNLDILPVIPSQGSVGASGDLAPLAHLALTLIGEGEVKYKGDIYKTSDLFKKLNIEPVKLQSKEGLVLINGTQVMTSNGLYQLYRVKNLIKSADIIASISLDALLGTDRAFDPKVVSARPHKGQIETGKIINKLIEGSDILKSHRDCDRVQDPYSLRCIPQVHGAVKDVIDYVEKTLLVEINSGTDNPLVFPDERDIISGGNFHGEPIAFAMDFMGIAIAELASISERRIEQLVNPHLNQHLPAFLVANEGINSGFMIAQVTAASLVSENKVYAHPSSVDSIPTSANKEDHVSMGTIGSNKAGKIVDNVVYVLAIEYLAASQGVEFRRPLKGGVGVEKGIKLLRKEVPFIEKDEILYPYIEKAKEIVETGKLVKYVYGG